MKRFRVKLVGFGLAALAGTGVAADRDWLPLDPPGAVVRAGGEPPVLPDSVRFASANEPAPPANPLWLPVTSAPVVPPAAHPADAPAALPDLRPAAPPVAVRPLEPAANPWPAAGPRVGAVPPVVVPEPGRDAPEWLPPPAPAAPRGIHEPVRPAPDLGAGFTQVKPPNSDAPVPMMTPPAPPGAVRPVPSGELPPPRPVGPTRPVAQPAGGELPVAPPDLMVPDCVPGKHGTFGSMPIRLSDDYPSLAELCGQPVRDRIALRHGDGRPDGSRGFIQAEYLLWWVPGIRIPVLGTTNPDPARFGFLGEPGTTSLLGPGNILGGIRHGVRVRGGLSLNDCGSCAIDGSVFVLGRREFDAVFSSSQFGVITRPIFAPNVQPGVGPIGESGEAVTVPNILQGSLSVHAESFLWGADLNLKHCLRSGCDWRAMWFVGYRYLNLMEEVSITENINVVGDGNGRVLIPDPPGSVVFVRDSFRTENRFNGGQVGLTYERRRGRFAVDGRASVAFGVTQQELDVFGVQVRTVPGRPPATFRGGLLAAGPNLGHFSRDRFSVVPELTLNVGYWVTPNFKAYVGYNFLYWSNVIRPGDQIDRVVDLTFVPNAPAVPPSGLQRPAALFRQTDLVVNGLQFGVEWRW